MITGRQIRNARTMLEWHLDELSIRANVPIMAIARAELTDGAGGLTPHQAELIQQAFAQEGLRFGRDGSVLTIMKN